MPDAFTNTPDFTPYTAITPTQPLDQMNPAPAGTVAGLVQSGHSTSGAATAAQVRALQALWAEASTRMFSGAAASAPDMADPRLLNRVIWYSVKGYTTPYPGDSKVLTPQQVLAQNHS
jgi:hypothetical protein